MYPVIRVQLPTKRRAGGTENGGQDASGFPDHSERTSSDHGGKIKCKKCLNFRPHNDILRIN